MFTTLVVSFSLVSPSFVNTLYTGFVLIKRAKNNQGMGRLEVYRNVARFDALY